ncbi:peptidase family M41-domain-containing protein [Tribonema minus]|uniref:Peptidase family M41-domain-containing protein n=1 Tax=Tribonema minus TaxID=303371 RepID=A0A835ZC64_9STRA|nr:peptidase family M41-domain-containing protein [Tribonema minus]
MPANTIHMAESSDKRFTDVVGVDEAKAELEEIVLYLKDPRRFTRLGGKLPRGILLTGPPGTGKTLLARAIAGEAGVPFFYTSGSEFEEMFVGVGAKRVRDLFREAKQRSPCIIFIDEIDAIGGSRTQRDQQSMKMTLNQLLVEMDGFEQNNGVIVIAATNFPEGLDRALVRPGRFDRRVSVPLPDINGRLQILELYSSKTKLDKCVDLNVVARGTPGMSGADLANLINQAALKASLDGANAVTMDTIEWAKDKILMGAELKNAVISEETAKMTAYHEGGHALVALKTDGADPIHKATIMPRGHSLGMVMQLPEGDQKSLSRKQMLARLDVFMGGRVAEELIFGADNITSGASSDIYQATSLARNMVTQYGMSSKVGIMFHDLSTNAVGGQTKSKIDDEVRLLLEQSYERATALLTAHRHDLETIAAALMEHETLSGAEIKAILSGKGLTNRNKPKPGVLQRAAAARSVQQ